MTNLRNASQTRNMSISPPTSALTHTAARDAHGVRNPSEREQLTKQAQTWVAQTFFGTLLKQMRNSPFKSELLSGGRGGEAFGSLYDLQLAQRMSRGAGSKLVKSIVRQLEAKSAYKKTTSNTQHAVSIL